MSGVTSVEIKENAEELAQLLQAQTNAKLKERLQVLYLLKLPQPMTISAIAQGNWETSWHRPASLAPLTKSKDSMVCWRSSKVPVDRQQFLLGQ